MHRWQQVCVCVYFRGYAKKCTKGVHTARVASKGLYDVTWYDIAKHAKQTEIYSSSNLRSHGRSLRLCLCWRGVHGVLEVQGWQLATQIWLWRCTIRTIQLQVSHPPGLGEESDGWSFIWPSLAVAQPQSLESSEVFGVIGDVWSLSLWTGWPMISKNWAFKTFDNASLRSFPHSHSHIRLLRNYVAGTCCKEWWVVVPRFEHICLFTDFPATCFRFEPGLGVQGENLGSKKSYIWSVLLPSIVLTHHPCTVLYTHAQTGKGEEYEKYSKIALSPVLGRGCNESNVAHLRRDSFREFEHFAIFEPCTQSYWSSNITWTQKPLRGCILGRSFHLYQEPTLSCCLYIAWVWELVSGVGSGTQCSASFAMWKCYFEIESISFHTRTMTSGVMGGMLLKQPGENLAFKGSTPWLTGAPCTSPVKVGLSYNLRIHAEDLDLLNLNQVFDARIAIKFCKFVVVRQVCAILKMWCGKPSSRTFDHSTLFSCFCRTDGAFLVLSNKTRRTQWSGESRNYVFIRFQLFAFASCRFIKLT